MSVVEEQIGDDVVVPIAAVPVQSNPAVVKSPARVVQSEVLTVMNMFVEVSI